MGTKKKNGFTKVPKKWYNYFLEEIMSSTGKLDIIKGAILLEYRGKALYDSVVKTTDKDSVKDLFQFLAEEEAKHIQILEKQFSRVKKNGEVELGDFDTENYETSREILSSKMVKDIFGAGYEAALISAALEFEKKAVEYYSKHEKLAETDGEKKLYKWLAQWEKDHMMMLAELDREIKEEIWHDNQFWPE